MEQVVLHLQLFSVRSKQLGIAADFVKEFKECANGVLKTITRWMDPSAYFNGIAKLLEHADGNVKKKVIFVDEYILLSNVYIVLIQHSCRYVVYELQNNYTC